MRDESHSAPVRGLCTLPELLEALLLFLPAGVALVCMETALATGLCVKDGEIYPGRFERTIEAAERHFRPGIPRLSREQRTLVQRMCDPLGAMGSAVQVTHLLAIHSDTIARQAVERGWLSDSDLAQIRAPDYRAFWDATIAALLNGSSDEA